MVTILRRPRWAVAEASATPEALFLSRRSLLTAGAGAALASALPRPARAEEAGLPPFQRNPAFTLDRPLTPESVNAGYNNFYEYTTWKKVDADRLRPRPWARDTVDGLCAKPFAMDVDDLIKAMPIEERLYRHRCVEAWSMTIPWVGFPLAELVKRAEPTRRGAVCPAGDVQGAAHGAGPARHALPLALCRGADHRRGDERPGLHGRPAPTARSCRRCTARRSGWRCRGSTASSRSSRSSSSPSSRSGR